MKFPVIEGAEWYNVVSRKESVMILTFMANLLTTEQHFQKLTGLEDYELTRWLYIDGDIFYDRKEVIKAKELAVVSNDQELFWRWARRCEEEGVKRIERTKALAERSAGKADKELLDLMMEYLDMMAEFTVFLMIPLSVEMSLQERITEYLQRKEKEELLPVLIFPEKENMNTVEQKSFLQLVEESRAGTLTDPMIQDHINAYGALSVRYGIGTFWTIEDVRRRIGNFEEDPAAMLQELKEQVEENRKQTAEALDELDAPDDIRSLVKLIKEYVYLRTYRSTVLSNSYVYAQPIFERVAAERGLSYQELNFCAYHEVLDDAIPSKEELARRQEGYSAIAQKPRLKIVTGKGIEEMRTFYGLDIDTEGITTVEGISAYPGTIQGTAKIVRSNEVLDKVKRGDILIASMTTPDFIPAMEKAAAFVTDEGGILCHAAIVARELKKTCVIGTKHATKVFKDGDLIEIDADKGTVKKVE